MIETYCRPALQKWLFTPTAHGLAKLNIKPNQVTTASGIFGIAAAILIAFALPWFALAALLISGMCDILDGSLARLTQHSSSFGCVYDIMTDRIVEAALLIGFYCQAPSHRALTTLILLSSFLLCITSFLVVGIFSQEKDSANKSFDYSPGLIERPEAFVFFSAMIAWPAAYNTLCIILSLLTLYTAGLRIWQFKKLDQC